MSEAIDGDDENRKEGMDDLENLSGFGQWPDTIRRDRELAGRPVLTINRLPQFVRQVTGDLRKMNPAIKVIAADSTATPQIAEIYEGLTRHIEARSSASDVYEGAAESAAACGIGNFRIRTDYENYDSFDQEILIERIHNPFAVYWDPNAREATRSDAEYCFITDQMKADDFKKAYPDANMTDAGHDGTTDGLENWHEGGSVVVAEYYWKDHKDVTINLLNNGEVIEGEKPVAPLFVIKTRKTQKTTVKWAKVSGTDVLEGPKDIPCRHIPVVAVIGEEMHVGERIVRTGVIRYAKDPQRMYNYASSTQTEVIALQPKAPFIGTVTQFEGLQRIWDNANTSTAAYLAYNPDPLAPGPPQRSQPPVASQGLSMEIAKAADDMKATTGIYDAGLGGQSNEKSGVAIRQRQIESDISTSIYSDNLAKSIGQCGRIVVDMIPRVYDTQRVVRVVGDDDQETMVTINAMGFDDALNPVQVNHLDAGRYDVRVTVGPNYTTRRQETQEGMISFLQAIPAAGQVAPDLFAKAMDWPDADKLAKRFKKTLPPGTLEPDEMEPEEQQAMQQQQQAAAQQGQKQEAIQGAMIEAEIRSKTATATENEADAVKAQADAQKAQAEAQKTQVETAILSGQMNDLIGQIVQQQVTAALQNAMQQGFVPQ
jgi:hypothetical protein